MMLNTENFLTFLEDDLEIERKSLENRRLSRPLIGPRREILGLTVRLRFPISFSF